MTELAVTELKLGNAIPALSGTEFKNLDEKMLLSTPDICGLWIKQQQKFGTDIWYSLKILSIAWHFFQTIFDH